MQIQLNNCRSHLLRSKFVLYVIYLTFQKVTKNQEIYFLVFNHVKNKIIVKKDYDAICQQCVHQAFLALSVINFCQHSYKTFGSDTLLKLFCLFIGIIDQNSP